MIHNFFDEYPHAIGKVLQQQTDPQITRQEHIVQYLEFEYMRDEMSLNNFARSSVAILRKKPDGAKACPLPGGLFALPVSGASDLKPHKADLVRIITAQQAISYEFMRDHQYDCIVNGIVGTARGMAKHIHDLAFEGWADAEQKIADANGRARIAETTSRIAQSNSDAQFDQLNANWQRNWDEFNRVVRMDKKVHIAATWIVAFATGFALGMFN